MKLSLVALFSVFAVACGPAQNGTKTSSSAKTNVDYANSITAEDLSKHLYIIADDKMEGRMTGSVGQKMAGEYMVNHYKSLGMVGPIDKDNYYQAVPKEYFSRARDPKDSENIVAFIKGSEKPDEIIVLSAHYDHVGKDKDGNIYNGADDDGSGTVSMLEMAEAFQMAVKDGKGPKRSILFLHVTGEEIGLYGSRYYTDNPLFPLANTVCNLNTDMIGRIDPDKADSPNYIYLIGADKLSQELHDVSEMVNEKYVNLELDYKYNDDDDPNRFYYRSDHYNFAKNNIPVIFYFNGTHDDYHQITDTPDKIEYELMAKRTKLIFLTAWELANREGRITADKATE